MAEDRLKRKLITLFLTVSLALSMTGISYAGVFAFDEEAPGEDPVEMTDDIVDTGETGGNAVNGDVDLQVTADEPEVIKRNDIGEEDLTEEPLPNETGTDEIGEIEAILVSEDITGKVEIQWNAVDEAAYYRVRSVLPDDSVDVTCVETICVLDGLARGTNYGFIIEAYKAGDEENILIAKGTAVLETKLITFDENAYRTLTSKTVKGTSLGIELRAMLGEAAGGYSVVQGGCTDGTYAYYLMVKTSNQRGRVLKVNLNNKNEIYSSAVIDICHGNGMTYDSKDHMLVVVGREERRTQLTLIDARTLKFHAYKEVDYSAANENGWRVNYNGQKAGLAAISYITKYDCFVALQRYTHDLLVLDKDFKVIGFVDTNITAKYPGVYQAMDADEKYVYLLLSYHSDRQPYNRIIALDWNSENLLDYINCTGSELPGEWACNNSGSGTPDADIVVKTSHEAENIFHITDASGNKTFYLSEYYNNPKYKWVTKKKAYKVKWKKVKKRVKIKGKWKTKRVWKYKKKYKKVKVKQLNYYDRKGYVYKLNSI